MRRNQQTKYTLSKQFSFMDLVEAIKYNGSTLTPSNFIASLNPGEEKALLNYVYKTSSTVLKSCITSEREDKLEFFRQAMENEDMLRIGAEAILSADELLDIFISEKLSNELRPAFFEVAMNQIYKRMDKITSINDEVFAHIHVIEKVLSIYKDNQLRNDLIRDGFPQKFRSYLAPILSEAGINHAEFITKLHSFNTNFSISRAGNAEWLTLLTPPTKDVVVEVEDVTVVSDESSRRSSDGSNSSAEEGMQNLHKEGIRKRNVVQESKDDADTDPLLSNGDNSDYHQRKTAEKRNFLDNLRDVFGL